MAGRRCLPTCSHGFVLAADWRVASSLPIPSAPLCSRPDADPTRPRRRRRAVDARDGRVGVERGPRDDARPRDRGGADAPIQTTEPCTEPPRCTMRMRCTRALHAHHAGLRCQETASARASRRRAAPAVDSGPTTQGLSEEPSHSFCFTSVHSRHAALDAAPWAARDRESEKRDNNHAMCSVV